MDRETTEESKRAFREQLRGWNIPVQVFQVLEVVFRQSLMSHKKTGYKYNNEEVDKSLCGQFKPPERLARLGNYVTEWEARTKLRYGFEALHMNEVENIDAMIGQFISAKNQLEKLSSEFGLIVETSELNNWIADLKTKLKDRFSVPDRENGRFIIFDKTGDAKKVMENHDYVKCYLGIGYGVFHSFFQRIAMALEGEMPKGNDFNRFLAAKLRREHQDIKELREFTAEMVKKKIHNAKVDSKDGSFWAQLPYKLDLIDEEFIQHIASLALKKHSRTA